MRRLVLCLIALGLAAPASAQIAGRHDYGDVRMPERLGHDGRMAGAHPAREARDIRGDIRDLRDSGAISRREARRLSREARAIGRNSASLSAGSARAVDAQLLALRARVYAAQTRSDGARGRRQAERPLSGPFSAETVAESYQGCMVPEGESAMRKILISAAAIAAATIAMAAPASAQYGQRGGYDQRGYGQNGYANRNAVRQLMHDVERIEMRIQRSYQRRAISQREAHRLQREAGQLRQRIHYAGRDGISQREFYALRERVQRLQYHLREERRDGDNRRW